MKKKKFLWSLLLMMVAMTTVGLTSCGSDEEPDQVSVNMPSVNFSENGGTQIIQVLSNTKWTVSNTTNWLTVAPIQGSGNGQFTITASANTEKNSRNGALTITAGTASAFITVNQGYTPLSLSQMIEGVYVGKMTSGGVVVDDAYRVTLKALNSSSVEVTASLFGTSSVNFNLSESQGQVNLQNANYPDITMYVTNYSTLNISFVNAAQTMTSFIGTKN